MKFFVAKVDVDEGDVRQWDGHALAASLPLRQRQVLVAHSTRLAQLRGHAGSHRPYLARGQRYDVANYPNVTIPTNVDVDEKARAQFPAFYAALFDRTLEKNAKAIVTEYAWDAGSCDPCPIPALTI